MKLVTLQRMAKLVVAKPKRNCSRALVEAVATESILEQRTLIVRNRGAKVVG